MFAAVSMEVAEALLGIQCADHPLTDRVNALQDAGARPIGPPERNFWSLPDEVGLTQPIRPPL